MRFITAIIFDKCFDILGDLMIYFINEIDTSLSFIKDLCQNIDLLSENLFFKFWINHYMNVIFIKLKIFGKN